MARFDGSQSCAQTDPELFFWPETRLQAAKICMTCPIIHECAAYVEQTPGLYGTWAGKWRNGKDYKSLAPYPQGRKAKDEERYVLTEEGLAYLNELARSKSKAS